MLGNQTLIGLYLGKVPLTNEGFGKITVCSLMNGKKMVICKTLTERISRFLKKINDKNENETNSFLKR